MNIRFLVFRDYVLCKITKQVNMAKSSERPHPSATAATNDEGLLSLNQVKHVPSQVFINNVQVNHASLVNVEPVSTNGDQKKKTLKIVIMFIMDILWLIIMIIYERTLARQTGTWKIVIICSNFYMKVVMLKV